MTSLFAITTRETSPAKEGAWGEMSDNGSGRRNKLLIKPINTGINRCTNFHWWINSAGARSSNGAACHWHSSAMIFLHRSRSHRHRLGNIETAAPAPSCTLCNLLYILLTFVNLCTKTTCHYPAWHSIRIGVYFTMRVIQFVLDVVDAVPK